MVLPSAADSTSLEDLALRPNCRSHSLTYRRHKRRPTPAHTGARGRTITFRAQSVSGPGGGSVNWDRPSRQAGDPKPFTLSRQLDALLVYTMSDLAMQHKNAGHLAQSRETIRPVASSDERSRPTTQSPIPHDQ